MAEAATIARPYAEAAFRLAEDKGTIAGWSAALSRLAVGAESPELVQLLGDPRIAPAQLAELLVSVSADKDPALGQFVATLIENKRVSALPLVHEQFEALKNRRESIVDAQIDSALPLNDAQLAELVSGLETRFKRKIRPQVSIDPELIGGVRIAVGDEVIDASVRGKLAAMATALKH